MVHSAKDQASTLVADEQDSVFICLSD